MRLTWGEFKKQVEAQGIRDDDVISYIDTYGSGCWDVLEKVHAWKNPEFGVEITCDGNADA
jgi:hypothetical protein